MKRWLALISGLAVVALALYALVSGGGRGEPRSDIDPASRARLERVLEEADRAGDGS